MKFLIKLANIQTQNTMQIMAITTILDLILKKLINCHDWLSFYQSQSIRSFHIGPNKL